MAIELEVDGMTCQGCEEVVEKALEMADGAEEASADRYESVAKIEGDADPETLVSKVEMAGYEAST
jgi:copper chaperone CopZ